MLLDPDAPDVPCGQCGELTDVLCDRCGVATCNAHGAVSYRRNGQGFWVKARGCAWLCDSCIEQRHGEHFQLRHGSADSST